MSRPPILLLFNPASGGKPGGSQGKRSAIESRPDGESLRDALERNALSVRLHVLTKDEDPAELARHAASEGHDVVAAGGDGTVGRAATGLLGAEARLGVVPLGSFNNIARGARLPVEVDAAIDTITQGNVTAIDAGVAWTLDGNAAIPSAVEPRDAPVRAVWFFEAAGIGIDAAGFGLAAIPEEGIGPAIRALSAVIRRRRSTIALRVDGKPAGARSPAITICNGPFHGFGFALAPQADPSDGKLDVVVFRHMGRIEVLAHFLAVARGRPRREPRVQATRATSVIVGDGSEKLPVHADGELIGTTPVAFAVRPRALQLFRALSR